MIDLLGDLVRIFVCEDQHVVGIAEVAVDAGDGANGIVKLLHRQFDENGGQVDAPRQACDAHATMMFIKLVQIVLDRPRYSGVIQQAAAHTSEENTSKLQSLTRISYAINS